MRLLPVAFAVLLLAGAGCSACRRGPTTVAETRALLARELPAGTPCDRALAWLDERKIEHSTRTPASQPDASDDVIYAARRHVRASLAVDVTILIEVRCDRRTGRLSSVDVREGFTGP
jgi:hypothetical protein